jgi:predicted  nucleic acid-binding Zn-ribbon protein
MKNKFELGRRSRAGRTAAGVSAGALVLLAGGCQSSPTPERQDVSVRVRDGGRAIEVQDPRRRVLIETPQGTLDDAVRERQRVLQDLETEVDQVRRTRDTLQRDVADLTKRRDEVSVGVDVRRSDLAKVDEALADERARLANLQQQTAEARAERDRVASEMASLREAVAGEQAAREHLAGENNNLNNANASIRRAMTDAEVALRQNNERLRDLQGLIGHAEERLGELEGLIAGAEERLRDATAKAADARTPKESTDAAGDMPSAQPSTDGTGGAAAQAGKTPPPASREGEPSEAPSSQDRADARPQSSQPTSPHDPVITSDSPYTGVSIRRHFLWALPVGILMAVGAVVAFARRWSRRPTRWEFILDPDGRREPRALALNSSQIVVPEDGDLVRKPAALVPVDRPSLARAVGRRALLHVPTGARVTVNGKPVGVRSHVRPGDVMDMDGKFKVMFAGVEPASAMDQVADRMAPAALS